MKDCSRAWSRIASSLKLLLALALLFSLTTALPGCGGCTKSPTTAAQKKKQKQDEEEAAKKKKKKKELEKPKPNFEPIQVRMLPSNDPTLTDKTPRMNIKPGHWIAVNESTKANNFDFVGELATFAEAKGTNPPLPLELENTNSRLSVWRPASLPKGQTKIFETLLFIPKRPAIAGSNYALRSELRGLRGGGLQEPANNIASALREHEHILVVLASNPAAYTHLDKLHAVRMPEVEGFADETLNYYYIVRPNAEKRVPLPSHSLAWTTTSHVVWDDVNPAVLTADQQQAMLDWLHWGGQLIISGPSSLDKLKGSFLNAYLPAETAETVKLDQSAFDELNRVWSLQETKKKNRLRVITVHPDRPMVGIRFKKHVAAEEVAGTGGLVLERRIGGGRIVVTSFPLTDVRIKQWKNFDGFFNSALLRRPPRSFASHPEYASLQVYWADPGLKHMRLEPRLGSTLRYFSRDVGFLGDERPAPQPVATMPEVMPAQPGMPITSATAMAMQYGYAGRLSSEPIVDTTAQQPPVDDWHFAGYIAAPQLGVAAWRDDGAATDAARQALAEAAGIEIPKADFVFKVLVVYLAILVPLNWFVFWMLGRVEWAWIAAPIIAVVGAGAVIRLAQLDIGFARSRTEIAVLEVQGGYERAHLTRYTALYTSLSSSYRLAFAEPSSLALPLALPPADAAQQISAIDNVMFRRDQDTSLSGVQVQSNSTKMVHSEQMFPLAGKLTLVGDNQKGWTVKNTSNVTVRDVGVLRRGAGGIETAYVAKLDPQTSAPLAFAPLPPPPIKEATKPDEAGHSGNETTPSDEKKLPTVWLPEWNRSPVLAPVSSDSHDEKGHVRLTRLARLAVEQLKLLPGDVRLVGWTDEPLAGMQISPNAPQNKTYTLVLAHLARGELPGAQPDANVAEDYFEPPLDPEIEAEMNQVEAADAAEAAKTPAPATSGS